jgi:hypothetical protein
MTGDSCIYCGKQEFSDEHYLPRCLGNFRNYRALAARLCKECNRKCGQLDEQLCRSSGEAFFRRYLGIKGRKGHVKVNPFYRGSAGGQRLSLQGESIQTGLKVELELDEEKATPLRHIQFIAEDNSLHVVPITDDMKEPAQLRAAFDKLGIKRAKQADVYAAPNELGWIDHLLTGLKSERRDPWGDTDTPFTDLRLNFVVTDNYFRCLAKIGFHHFLQRMTQFRGSEDTFRDIRDFILSGGGIGRCNEFVGLRKKQLLLPLQQGYRPTVWGHLVTAHVDYFNLSAGLQLFVGPEFLSPIYVIKIGNNPSRVDYIQNEGTFFAYYPKEQRTEYDGEVADAKALTFTRAA